MAMQRHLAKAPITEAIVDIRVKARAGIEADEFRVLHDELKSSYPTLEPRSEVTARIEIKSYEARADTVSGGRIGFFWKNQAGTEVVQMRIDGFTFNRLPPYTSWDDIAPRALALWETYARVAKPEGVLRVALRYINRIALPSDAFAIEQFTHFVPTRPDGYPNVVESFLTSLTLADDASGARATVTEAVEPATENGRPALLIDIEASKSDILTASRIELEPIFDVLRKLKNRLFFSTLTEVALQPYL